MIIITQEKAKAKTKRIEKTKRDEITSNRNKMSKPNYNSRLMDNQDSYNYRVRISLNKWVYYISIKLFISYDLTHILYFTVHNSRRKKKLQRNHTEGMKEKIIDFQVTRKSRKGERRTTLKTTKAKRKMRQIVKILLRSILAEMK